MSPSTAAPTIDHAARSSEELLAEYAATRCERAFEALFKRHQEEVHDYLASFLCSHDDADDVSQEVFLLIHQHPDKYDPDRLFRPWLFVIAGNQAINFQEKQRTQRRCVEKRPTLSLTCPSNETQDENRAVQVTDHREIPPEEDVTRRETGSHLRRMVAGLPDCERKVVHALYFEQMTHREAAQALGIPLGTVKSRNHRALSLLRIMLSREEDATGQSEPAA